MNKNIVLFIILLATLFHAPSNQAIFNTYYKYQNASIKTLGGTYCLILTAAFSYLALQRIQTVIQSQCHCNQCIAIETLNILFEASAAATSLHSAIVLFKSAYKDFVQKNPTTAEIQEINFDNTLSN